MGKVKIPEKTVITTGVVAAHCQVSYETVKQWIRQGKLPAYATPGRRHYIQIDDFRAFLDTYGMPPFDPGRSRKRKILVVDDEACLVQMITQFLTDTGDYECTSASNGYEAGVQVMAFRPDLVILDLIMPRIDGFTVCQKLKATPATQHILVLAVTAYPEDGDLETIIARGADACLVKPFTMQAMKQQVETLFTKRLYKPRPKSMQASM